jgi:protein-L-isoaspartate O-methyltransferase
MSLETSDTPVSFFQALLSQYTGNKFPFCLAITCAMSIIPRGLFVAQNQSKYEISRAYNNTPVALRFNPQVNLSISGLHFPSLHAFYAHFENENRKPARVLDIGMGSGYVLYVLKYLYPDAECVGVEVFGDLVGRSKKLIPVIHQRLQDQESFWKRVGVNNLELEQQHNKFWRDHKLDLDLRCENIFDYIDRVCFNEKGQLIKTFDIIHGGALTLNSTDVNKLLSILSPGGIAIFPFKSDGNEELSAFYKDLNGKIYKKEHISWVIYTPLVHQGGTTETPILAY